MVGWSAAWSRLAILTRWLSPPERVEGVAQAEVAEPYRLDGPVLAEGAGGGGAGSAKLVQGALEHEPSAIGPGFCSDSSSAVRR